MKLSTLRANPTNPRIIKDEKFQKLVTSIKEFPEMLEARPIVVNPEMVVIGGNMRFKACKAAGLKEAPVYMATWGETKDREFIIKDNVSSGENDFDILANEWDAEELNEWGLDVWTGEPEETEGLTDPDDVPEVPEEAKTKLGDLYILGEHRLLCGDSTKVEDVEKLMNGEKADVGFTSPPYALGKSAKLSGNKANKKRGNAYEDHDDNAQDWASLMSGFYKAFDEYVDAWCVNVQPLAGNKRALFEWIAENSFRLIDVAIWAKTNPPPAMASNVLTSGFEMLVFLGQYNATRSLPFASFRGNQNNVYTSAVNNENKEASIHGAAMPSHLPKWVLGELFSEAQSVVEPFAGTGTTFIVCEELNRKCYGMELDRKYCDVIVKRWEDFTGKKASKQ